MEPFKKYLAREMLGKIVEQKSQNGTNDLPAEATDEDLQQLLASMPEEKFKKIVNDAIEKGDKAKVSTLLSNWPFNKK
ncbi:MAG: hypothetical protein KBC12_01720 [Candidatus Pacebacteria bacterium]|nr:hypothetical protein [Candidatus Paceibacterota bacterium]MBP9851404.1 hypothetical protein [Candidatus Paceibacterota bacterium]